MGNRFNMLKSTLTYRGKRAEAASSRAAFRLALRFIKQDYPDRWQAIHDSIPAVARFDELKYNLPKMQAVLYKICLMLGDLQYGKDIRIDGKTRSRKFTKPDREVRFSTKQSKRNGATVQGNGAFAGTTVDEDEEIEALTQDFETAKRRLGAAVMRKKIKATMGLSDAGFDAIIEELSRNQRG